MAATVDQIQEILKTVNYPGMSRDIVSFGMVKGIDLNEQGEVVLALEFKTNDDQIQQQIGEAVHKALEKLPGLSRLEIRALTKPEGEQPRMPGLNSDPFAGRKPIPGIKHIIAVASGKGGVGKSTVATNLAVALAKKGRKVGLMDSDIYGPSVHMMFGATDLRPTSYDGKTLEPFVKHGVKFMSIGLLLGEGTPVIWRGPMVIKMVDQFLNDVNWGDLDDLVIDLPPGTGDAQLTLVQKVPIAGAVIVTTPQNVALADAVRGLEMFRRVEVPVIGFVENMSYFACPNCDHRTDIFSHGGGARTAQELGVPLLTEVPLEAGVRESGDEGKPIVLASPDSAPAIAFAGLADKVADFVDKANVASEPRVPKLNVVQSVP